MLRRFAIDKDKGKKLEPKWEGPYRVPKVTNSGVSVLLEDLCTGRKMGRYAVDDIKTYLVREQMLAQEGYTQVAGRETGVEVECMVVIRWEIWRERGGSGGAVAGIVGKSGGLNHWFEAADPFPLQFFLFPFCYCCHSRPFKCFFFFSLMSGTRGGSWLKNWESLSVMNWESVRERDYWIWREHVVGLGGSFPVFRSPCLSCFSFFSPVVVFSEGKPVDRCC